MMCPLHYIIIVSRIEKISDYFCNMLNFYYNLPLFLMVRITNISFENHDEFVYNIKYA